MIGSALGFHTKTTKSEVGKYFKKIQETVQITKDKLNQIVSNMEKENHSNFVEAKTVINKLFSEKLNKIIDGAKIASGAIGDASDPIANVASENAGAAGTEVDNLIKGIKDIVEVVLKEGNAEAGDANGPCSGF